MDDTPKQRISAVTAIFMLAVAMILWGAQLLVAFIPGVDVVLDFILGIFGDMIFGVWFLLCGVNYFSGSKSGSKLAAMFTTVIIESVPLLNGLPALPIGVATLIWATRKEDADKIAHAPQQITTSRPVREPGVDPRYTNPDYYMQNVPQEGVESDEELDDVGSEAADEYETA